MALKIVILASAEHDFHELHELKNYIVNNFSANTWRSTYAELKDAIRHLQNFPRVGVLPAELEKLNLSQYRQVVAGMNRIIHEVRQDIIYIHVIADARRDMHALLMRRLLRTT